MRRWQCLFIIAGLLWALSLYAVPTFSPAIDGVKDAGWGGTPDEATTTLMQPDSFHLDSGLYVTDDAENLYFGFWGTPDPWEDNIRPHIHILIDTANSATGGNEAPWGASALYGMTYLPDYQVMCQWGDNWGDEVTIGDTYLIGWLPAEFPPRWWNQSEEIELTNDAGGADSWTEICIPRALIGELADGTVLNLSMWLRPSWNVPGGNACLPADAAFPSTDGGTSWKTLTAQFAYTIQTMFGDTTAPRLQEVHQIDRKFVRLTYDEPMNIPTIGVTGNYTAFGGWVITGAQNATALTVDLQNGPDFVDGSPYSVLAGPNVQDAFGNSIDPDFDSLGWISPTYGVVTFLVHDPGATQDFLVVRGSFNDFHEHDFGWSGVEMALYDDGTHGDLVSGDNTHTLATVFVPQPADSFEWKVLSDEGVWLVPDDNLTFFLLNTDSVETSYTLPDTTVMNVLVTYSVDMNCTMAPFDSITIAGSHDVWSGTLMTDAGGGIFTYNHLFPTGTTKDQVYKFRYHFGGGTEWEGIDGNRLFSIDDSFPIQILPTHYFSDDTCTLTTQNVTVTFVVDMQCITLGVAVDSVFLVGDFNGWGIAPIKMADSSDGTFSTDNLFPTGSITEQGYKFLYFTSAHLDTAQWEDAIPDRVLVIDDSGPTQLLDNAFFNDWICPPAELTAAVDGDSLRLRWVGPSRTIFDIFKHTVPDSIIENGVLLGTTTETTLGDFFGPGSEPFWYQVRASLP